MMALNLMTLAAEVQTALPGVESGNPEDIGRFLIGWALVFVATGLVAMPLIKALLRSQLPLERVFFARWGFTHVATVAITILGGNLVLAVLMLSDLIEIGDRLFPTLVWGALPMLSGALVVAYFARRFHPEKLEALGWKLDERALRTVPAALLGYLGVLPALFGVGILWTQVVPFLGVDHELQPLLIKASELTGMNRLYCLVLVAGVVPLLEEWLFRGFLQPLLVQNLRETGGIVVTSIIFASLHGTSAFMPVFCLSLYLGLVQLQSHRLLGSWAVHAAHNALTLLIVWMLPDALEFLGS